MKSNLTIHCVVKNEERWILYALKSILDIADEILIFDTGSTDKTVEIIKTIKTKKELAANLKSVTKSDWGIVVRAWNLVGDFYHYPPESVRYHWPFAPKGY